MVFPRQLGLLYLVKIHRMMKQEPISCRPDNALAARCQSHAERVF